MSTGPFSPVSTGAEAESDLSSPTPPYNIGHSAAPPDLDVAGRTMDSPSRDGYAQGLHPDSHDREGVFVVIDHSNLHIGLTEVLGDQHAHLDTERLQALMCDGSTKAQAHIYTSTKAAPSDGEQAWLKSMESVPDTFVHNFCRSPDGKEEVNDVELGDKMGDIRRILQMYRLHNDAGNHPKYHIPLRTVSLGSGDSDFYYQVVALINDGIGVTIWAWKKSIAAEYKELEKKLRESGRTSRAGRLLFEIRELDDHITKIAYRKRTGPMRGI